MEYGYVNDWEYNLGWYTQQPYDPGDVIIIVSGRDSFGGFTIKMDRSH
jgi:hypothetical protein